MVTGVSRMRRRQLLLALAVPGCLFGCPERPDLDLVPPRVISVEPAVTLVPVTVSFGLTFSEPLNGKSIFREDEGETVIIVERAAATSAFLTDFNNPPLIESRQAALVPVEVKLEGGDTVLTVSPLASLRPGTAYTLLVSADVRDASGNPLFGAGGANESFRLDFTTDDGPPFLADDDIGSGLVVTNRKYFRLTFNQGVAGLSADTIAIEPANAAAEALVPTAEAVLISEDRSEATLVLADGTGCDRLAPNADYELRVGPGLSDDEGEGMDVVRLPFTTGSGCDLQPNVLVSAPHAVPTDVAATIRFSTTKASTTEVRYGIEGAALDCLGAVPCPVVAAPATSPAPDSLPPTYPHSALLGELTVGESYAFTVRAEDETGSVATGSGSFVTAPLPKIAINEIMGNAPNVPEITLDFPGEYIELVNFGDEDVELSGWSVTVATTTCWLPDDGPTLAPGEHLLLVPGNFVYDYYGVDPLDAVALPPDGGRLCGGITNDRIVPITLSDVDGRPVSTFSGYAHVDNDKDGRSVERTAPDAPDLADSFCYSRSADGPTPLAENGVALRGCDQ